MKTFIDLTAIHRRMAPKQKLTAIEEWHRLERRDTWIAGSVIALTLAVGIVIVAMFAP